MAKSKGLLKNALSQQQARLKKKAKAQEVAQVREKISSAKSAKAKGKERATTSSVTRSTVPFKTTDTILLIGEGNFSFAAALFKHPALEHLPSANVTATAYDTEEECVRKYPDAKAIIDDLKARGAQVLFGVDATALEKCKLLRGRTFDRIVWNFPHAGRGITDQDRNILSNQMLLLGFLRSAESFLTHGPIPSVQGTGEKTKKRKTRSAEESDGDHDNMASDGEDTGEHQDGGTRYRGTLLVTLRNVQPYTDWKLTQLAKKPPPPVPPATTKYPVYTQLRSFAFKRGDWPGYAHRMTKGERVHGAGSTGVGGEDRTWEFCLKDCGVRAIHQSRR